MVCLGNICRSPMAEGILRKKAMELNLPVTVDSAGTGSYHVGENPDPRAIKTAKQFGIDISGLSARQISENDFTEFDLIYAMDEENLRDISTRVSDVKQLKKVKLFLVASGERSVKNVPDPWYGSMQDFVEVFKLLNQACDRIILSIKAELSGN